MLNLSKAQKFFLGFVFSFSVTAHGAIHHSRFEQQMTMTGQLQPILQLLSQSPGFPKLAPTDFLQVESRKLANYRFTTYLQVSQNVPIKGAMIRTWESATDGHLVLLEANVEDAAPTPARAANMQRNGITSFQLLSKMGSLNSLDLAKTRVLSAGLDRAIVKVNSQDQWNGNDLERVIQVKGRRGIHTITFSHLTGRVKSQAYRQYPQGDIPALVFPIYEETSDKRVLQQRIPVTLHNLNATRLNFSGDPYAALKTRHYYASLQDDVLSATPSGKAAGYWSLNGIKQMIAQIMSQLPKVANDFASGGMLLEGKYATINLHPEVGDFAGIKVPLKPSEKVMFDWEEATVKGQPDYELTINSSFKSQPLKDANAALNRPARRLPDHDPASYINDGFDEVQVYYAVDTLVESLQAMGFTDPELSTRPFNAFLFNPDIEYKDNAFYTDDTINFTTYSGDQQNAARDNSTIWHELGHGVMDRLMGDRIHLADTGGLSEGMADFVAQLVIQSVTNGVPFDGDDEFRIKNTMGFNLTNEVHDDGEAYGGSMNDLMVAAFAKEGRAGLVKVTDITLDAMRLARNHPALTANDWFDSILFADHLGHPGLRAPDELKPLISQALAKRNFRFDRGTPAEFIVKADGNEVTGEAPGTRENPIVQHLRNGGSVSHDLELSLQSSDTYKFKYPVTIAVEFNGGPLQGAVRWAGEVLGPQKLVVNNEAELAKVRVTALAECDQVNQQDGSCKDFIYLRVFNNGEKGPVAKKRFYLNIVNDDTITKSRPAGNRR